MKNILFVLILAALTYTQTMPTGYVEWWQQGSGITGNVTGWTGVNGKTFDSVSNVTLDGDTLEFSGTSSYMQMSSYDSDFDPGTGNFTVAVQYRYNYDANNNMGIFSQKRNATQSSTAYSGYALRQYLSGRVILYLQASDAAAKNASYASPVSGLTSGQTYVFVFTVNRTANTLDYYVGGSAVATDYDISGLSDGPIESSVLYPLTLGAYSDLSAPYDGGILEFAYYNRELTAGEVSTLTTVFESGEVTDEQRGFNRINSYNH